MSDVDLEMGRKGQIGTGIISLTLLIYFGVVYQEMRKIKEGRRGCG